MTSHMCARKQTLGDKSSFLLAGISDDIDLLGFGAAANRFEANRFEANRFFELIGICSRHVSIPEWLPRCLVDQ